MSCLGLAGRARDRLEGLGGGLRVAGRQALPGAGLDDHHADRVGDDVVQLGGDPRALVADRERRVRLALLLELARALRRARPRPARARAAPGPRPSAAGGMSRTGATPRVRDQAASRPEPPRGPAARPDPPQRLVPAPGAERVRRDEEVEPKGPSSDRAGRHQQSAAGRDQPRRAGVAARGRRARRRAALPPRRVRAPCS